MTDLYAPVDAEGLAVDYLKSVGAVTDLVTTDGISTRLPRDWEAGDRHVRLTRIGGLPTDVVGYLDRARIQVDAFGTDEGDAHALAGQVLVALRRLPAAAYSYAGAVVTAVNQDLGMANVPDPDTDAARYLFGVVLYVHPTGS